MASANFYGGMPAMTAQAVLLVPMDAIVATPTASATATPIATPTKTATPTAVATATGTAAATPTPVIRFVAHGPLTDSSQPVTNVAVSVPAGILSGDLLLAQIVTYDGTGTDVPSSPAGWTVIRQDHVTNGNKLTSWLFYRVAGGSEPASYTWHIALQYAAGVMGAWRSTSTMPIDQATGLTGAGVSPISAAAPSLTPAADGELQVYFYGSQSAAAPTITEPAAIIQRANIPSAIEGFTLAFGELAAPAGGTGSPTYNATASTNFAGGMPVITAQAVLLRVGP